MSGRLTIAHNWRELEKPGMLAWGCVLDAACSLSSWWNLLMVVLSYSFSDCKLEKLNGANLRMENARQKKMYSDLSYHKHVWAKKQCPVLVSYSKVNEKQQTEELDIWHQRRHSNSRGMVIGVCNSNTWGVGAGQWFWGQPELEQWVLG